MGQKPIVSVIIPVYNSEEYLTCCIDSVLSQTFTDYEIILVDDGSTDKSGSICEQYASADSRVRTVHKANGGVSSARNMGLDLAVGRYITFLDSDDWLEHNFLEVSVNACENRNLAIFATGIISVSSENGRHHSVIPTDYFMDIETPDEKIITDLLSRNYISSSCGKCYSREIIGNTRFNCDWVFGEDLQFVFTLLQKKGPMEATSSAFYNYRNTPGSATKKVSIQKAGNVVSVYQLLFSYAQKNNYSGCFLTHIQNRWRSDLCVVENMIIFSREKTGKKWEMLKTLLSDPDLNEVIESGDEPWRAYPSYCIVMWMYYKIRGCIGAALRRIGVIK